MKENVVLIGAGSAVFTRGLVADMIRQGWEGGLSLVDVSQEALAVAEGLARKMIEAGRSKLVLSAATDRRQALRGATVVICTIGVGGRRAWEQDVLVPRRHGIFQPVGDSVMPGGTSRALRMIPPMVDIARDVLEIAPEALFFNYGNPMTAICRAVRRETGAGMIGLCHGVFHVASELAGLLGVPRNELACSAVGVNHLTWFVELRHGGRDLMPRMHEIAAERAARGGSGGALGKRFAEAGTAKSGEAAPENPFCWRLFELFGAYPAVGDRHVTEFFGRMFSGKGAYFGRTMGVDCYGFEQVISWGDRAFSDMKEAALSPRPLPEELLAGIGGEHEQVTEIVASIRSDALRVFSANLPNAGQVPNLPEGAVLESPAVTAGGTLRPVMQRPLPAGCAGTLATRLQWVETVVDAALLGSREKFVQALILDGCVESVDAAYALADDLLAAQAEHLPRFASARRRGSGASPAPSAR